jgi:hypothetical protein
MAGSYRRVFLRNSDLSLRASAQIQAIWLQIAKPHKSAEKFVCRVSMQILGSALLSTGKGKIHAQNENYG